MTKSMTAKHAPLSESKSEGAGAITRYNHAPTPEHAAICNALRKKKLEGR